MTWDLSSPLTISSGTGSSMQRPIWREIKAKSNLVRWVFKYEALARCSATHAKLQMFTTNQCQGTSFFPRSTLDYCKENFATNQRKFDFTNIKCTPSFAHKFEASNHEKKKIFPWFHLLMILNYIHQGDWVIRYSTKRYFHGVIKAWNRLRIELIKYAPTLQSAAVQR